MKNLFQKVITVVIYKNDVTTNTTISIWCESFSRNKDTV